METLKATEKAMSRDLSPSDRERLDEALRAIVCFKFDCFGKELAKFKRNIAYEIEREDERRLEKALYAVTEKKFYELLSIYDGKNARELIAYADQIDEGNISGNCRK
ncbi:MAG: hypothetical protein LBI57_02020 [Helicobacteraceae bacterium]|nr:hypothetical protein [Helicobacteraceae bacterium]